MRARGRAQRRGERAGRRLMSACAALLAVATLALAAPARASVIDLSDYTGSFRWARYKDEAAGDDGGAKVYWVLEDGAGEWVDEVICPSGGNSGLVGTAPAGVSHGFWCVTASSVGTEPASLFVPDRAAAAAIGLMPEVIARIDHAAADRGWAPVAPVRGETGEDSDNGWLGKPVRGYEEGDLTDPGSEYHDVEKPDLSLFNLGDFVWWTARQLYRSAVFPIVMFLASACSWVVQLADPTPLFTGDAARVASETLFQKAQQISSSVAAPIARVLLGIAFTTALLDPARPRGDRFTDSEWAKRALTAIACAALSWVLIDHAASAVWWVYQIGAGAAQAAVDALGPAAASGLGASITGQASLAAQKLTYGELGYSVLLIAALLFCAKTVFSCVAKILTVACSRIAEIYLGAALASIPLSALAAGEGSRSAARYLRRLLAVTMQAALIVCALGLMGPLNTIASDLVAGLIARSPANGLVQEAVRSTLGAVIPTVLSVSVCSALVDKCDQVAFDMFGAPPAG